MRVTILDYGLGNLHSIAKVVSGAGAELRIVHDPIQAIATDALILPGVGAFAPAAAHLGTARATLRAAILDGLPTLGICLGMQLLFDGSDEGPGAGLSVFAGSVRRLRAVRLPQIGWNDLESRGDPLLEAAGLRVAYYANSFACHPSDAHRSIAWSTHESERFVAAVRSARGTCVGVQFHPEKSSLPGVRFIQQWLRDIAQPSGPTMRRTEGVSS